MAWVGFGHNVTYWDEMGEVFSQTQSTSKRAWTCMTLHSERLSGGLQGETVKKSRMRWMDVRRRRREKWRGTVSMASCWICVVENKSVRRILFGFQTLSWVQ